MTTPKKIWSPRVIGWTTLLGGITSGLIVASMNWARMGHRLKAILHALLGVGYALLYAYSLRNYIGLSSRETFGLSPSEYALRVLLNYGLTFLVIAYLYLTTQKDMQHLQAVETPSEKASLVPVIIAAIVALTSFKLLTVLVANTQSVAFRNHVYCELLKPGMTASEVNAALSEIGPHQQVDFGSDQPKTEVNDFAYFRVVLWTDSAFELNRELLGLGLGYNRNDELVWVSRYSDPDGFQTVRCP